MDTSAFSLKDRVAIVTGGGGGIGKAVSATFAEAGANVVVVGRTKETLEVVAEQIRAKGRKALTIPTDCRVPEQVNNMVKKTMDEFGRIDILSTHAGGAYEEVPIIDVSEEKWDHDIALNLKTVFLTCQAVARVMIRQKKGSIINANCGGKQRIGWNWLAGIVPYLTAIAGITALTEAMAAAWGQYGIRVNGIGIEFIDTPRTVRQYAFKHGPTRDEAINHKALKHHGKPDDIGAAALYLASDASEFVTGALLHVDGGPWL